MFLLLFLSLREFALKHTLWPPSLSEKGLFGRSVSFSKSRVAVGAEYVSVPGFINHNRNFTGVIYIYDYDPATDSYVINQGNGDNRISPEKVTGISPGTVGSKIMLSSDGKTLIAGAPYSDIWTEYDGIITIDPNQTIETYNYSDGSYYLEVGALFLFKEGDGGKWHQSYVSVPQNIVCKGGYGRSISGSSNIDFFASSYFNKIMPNLPEYVGQVFSTRKTKSSEYEQNQVIMPPEGIDNPKTQRFGASLDFHQSDRLYITSLAKKPDSAEEGDEGGVFEYKLSQDQEWKLSSHITAINARTFDQFGVKSSFRGNSLAAIYGRKNTNPKQNNIFILPKINDEWSVQPQQTISFITEDVSDIFFCSSNPQYENNFLAVIISNYVLIYEQKKGDIEYSLIQNVTDPRAVHPNVTVPYDQQFVEFGSDFSWEVESCSKFIVGAMGKYGSGKDVEPNEFSRAYIYEIREVEEPKEDQKLGIIVGCSVAAIVLIIIIVLVIFIRRRNRVRDGHISIDLIGKTNNV